MKILTGLGPINALLSSNILSYEMFSLQLQVFRHAGIRLFFSCTGWSHTSAVDYM